MHRHGSSFWLFAHIISNAILQRRLVTMLITILWSYNTTKFNVDSKLSVISTRSQKNIKKKLKQTNANAHLVRLQVKIREDSPVK